VAVIELLAERGFRLHRPYADNLGDGIYELRSRRASINYRVLYFFHGQTVVILTRGFTKERRVPPLQIAHTKDCRQKYLRDPEAHSYSFHEDP
jgi:hypothetical protein